MKFLFDADNAHRLNAQNAIVFLDSMAPKINA